MKQTYFLVFNDLNAGHIQFTMQLSLDDDEFGRLNQELEVYNNWSKALITGLAPLNAYRDPKFADELYQNPNKHCDQNTYPLVLMNDSEVLYFNVDTTDPKKFLDPELFRNIITAPLSLFDIFSLGYRVLPMTQKILESLTNKP